MRLGDVASLVSGRLENGDANAEITGVQHLQDANEHDVSFLSNMRFKKCFSESAAGAVFLSEKVFPETRRTVIRVGDPYLAFALLQRHFNPPGKATGERSESAFIHPSSRLAEDVDVAPMAVIGANVEIDSGSRIGAACVIEDGVRIGKDCLIHARVVLASGCILGNRVILQPGAVVGSDGFGYAWTGMEHLKIPQTGRVVIEDNVEIGANTCIDRGAIGDTVIKDGVKLDNLIQIGHNVKIGTHSIMASQVGISGSTRIGRGCQIGGQAGIAGHLEIGSGCKLAAQSGVLNNLAEDGIFAGSPAMPHRQWLKVSALLQRLPGILKTLNVRSVKRWP